MAAEDVDYKYWASLDRWSRKETALLMDAKDPSKHKSIRLNSRDLPGEYAQAARIAKALERIDWEGRYGASAYQVSGNPIFAIHALLSTGWDAPSELREALAERQEREAALNDSSQADNNDNEQPVSARTRERNTMLKLILGFACGGYGLDPDAQKNKHAKAMRVDLEKVGLPLDDDTIKKYLDEARALRRKILAKSQYK